MHDRFSRIGAALIYVAATLATEQKGSRESIVSVHDPAWAGPADEKRLTPYSPGMLSAYFEEMNLFVPEGEPDLGEPGGYVAGYASDIEAAYAAHYGAAP